jgi:hypothetical protein
MIHGCAVKRFFWPVLVVLVAQVAVMPNALAYEETRTEYGARLRLTSLPVRVRLDTPVPGFSDGGRAALLRAIASWNARACSSPLLVLTDDEDDVLIEIVPIVDQWKFGPVIAAHTAVDSEPYQGDIRHVVIEIDGRRKWTDDVAAFPEALDLESVLLHELGHALGLDHSRNQEAVMRAGIKPGLTRRVLHADDVAGICAVTKAVTVGKNQWLFAMLLFFLVGIGVLACTIVKRILARFNAETQSRKDAILLN